MINSLVGRKYNGKIPKLTKQFVLGCIFVVVEMLSG